MCYCAFHFSGLNFHPLLGINRHFHMACIHDKFTTSTGKRNISSEQLWQHLKELYNLPALVSTDDCNLIELVNE